MNISVGMGRGVVEGYGDATIGDATHPGN